jgi:L-threonylcarbamoyladenylate synthase
MPQVSLSELVAAARSGEHLISFPTDTVPALASRPDRAGLIYAAKQRSESKPLILMGAEAEDLWPYVSGSAAEQRIWQETAVRYFPGALTLVLPASPKLPSAMNPTDPTTIGIRVPNHPVARQILALTQPLATTSVNRSGQPPLLTMADIHDQFSEVLTLRPAELAAEQNMLPQASAIPSTVARWTGDGWEILRQGEVKLDWLNQGETEHE